MNFAKLIIASHNKGKVREIEALLNPFNIDVCPIERYTSEEPEENGQSFEENALIKARFATNLTHYPSLSDDSGLVVPALGGQPGIHSARWAGPNKDFSIALERLAFLLSGKSPRAYFVCVLALKLPNEQEFLFRSEVHGHLEFPPRGSHGHGYDPIFVKEGMVQTFGELNLDIKNQESARAKAMEKFLNFIKNSQT